jgi:signal peptidase I
MSPTTRRRLRRSTRLAGTALLVVTTLASAAFVLAGMTGFQRYAIVGPSMTGTYDLGSVVFDKPVPVADLRVGDVITYLPPPQSQVPHLVTHRIYSIRHLQGSTVYRTKGDANPAPDPWRFQLGATTQPRVVFAVPYAGFLFMGLSFRIVRILLVGVPAGLIALASLVEFLRSLRRSDSPAPDTAPVH